MSTRSSIVSDVMIYASSFVVAQFINLLLAFFIRHELGPQQMGVWVVLQVILNYSKFSTLGMGRVVSRDIPFYKGQGNLQKVRDIRNTAFSFAVSTSSFLAILILIAAFIAKGQVSRLVFYSSITLALMSVLQRILNFTTGILRAEKQFQFTSEFNLYSTLFSGAVTFLLVKAFGLYGYYVSLVLSLLFNFAFLFSRSSIRFKFYFSKTELNRIVKEGLPFLGINILSSTLQEIDRITVGLFLGVGALGIYSIVNIVNNIIYAFPNILNTVLWPYMAEAHGSSADSLKMKKYLCEPALFVAVYLPMLIGVLWLGAPPMIYFFLPKFSSGILAMKIGMFTILLRLLMAQSGQALITYERHWFMLPILGVTEALILFSAWAAVSAGGGLSAVAVIVLLGTAVGYFLYSMVSLRALAIPGGDILRHLTSVFGALLYFFLILSTMDFLFDDSIPGLLGRALWLVCCTLPVLWAGEKRFRTIETMLEVLGKRSLKP